MSRSNHIQTVGELIAALQHHDPTTPVRLATQPGHPFENTIGHVVGAIDEHADGAAPAPAVVCLGEGEQVGHLPDAACEALGWSA